MVLKLTFAIAGAVALSSQPARAQDATRGNELVQTHCANCHVAARQGDLTGRSGVPTFEAIANRPAPTFDGVVRWLRSVPNVMPNHRLTQDEILDLAEYIMYLRALTSIAESVGTRPKGAVRVATGWARAARLVG